MPASAGEAKLKTLINSFLKVSARNDDGSLPMPTWNDSDILFPSFYDNVLEWYPTVDPAYVPLQEYGYVRSGRQTAVTSVEHAIALHTDTVTRGTVAWRWRGWGSALGARPRSLRRLLPARSGQRGA